MARLSKGVTKLKNGRFRYRFTFEGKPYERTGATAKEAEEKGRKLLNKLESGAYIRNDAITLKDYAAEWLKVKEAEGKKGATLCAYRVAIKKHILPTLGNRKMQKVEAREIEAFLISLRENAGAGIANYVKGVLLQIFKRAKRNRIRNDNPCEGIPIFKDNSGKKAARETIHRALTDEERRIFLEAARGNWHYCLFRFLLATGLRVGEAAALTLRDVDFSKGEINVQRTATKDKNGRAIMGETTKTKASRRKVPMNDEIRAILHDQVAFLHNWRGRIPIADELLFINTRGGMVTESAAGIALCGIVKGINKCGVEFEKIGVHALRHTFASLAIRDGMKPNTLKAIMGHSTLAMTMDLYAHEYDESKREAMENLHIFDHEEVKEKCKMNL